MRETQGETSKLLYEDRKFYNNTSKFQQKVKKEKNIIMQEEHTENWNDIITKIQSVKTIIFQYFFLKT